MCYCVIKICTNDMGCTTEIRTFISQKVFLDRCLVLVVPALAHFTRWSSGKTQDSGARGPVFESHPDCRISLAENSSNVAPLHPIV